MKKINHLPVIKKLHSQLHELHSLSKILKSCVQEEWREYCEIVRIDAEQKKIIVSTSEQSLLMPLRFMQNTLLSQLKRKTKTLSDMTGIECIYTPLYSRLQKNKTLPKLSESSASSCEKAAEECSPQLKKSLMKLGLTLRERTPS